MSGVKQPKWYKPAAIAVPKLHINNSLTKKKEEFIPKNGNQVSFYICGPTVYDRTHLGHGRTFLTFDIIRRTMEDYFGYNVLFIMNITDIDDKIIINSRQNHLFLEFQNENQKEILPVQTALDFYKNQKFKKFGYEPDLDWSEFLAKAAKIPAEEEPKLKLFIKTAEQTMKQIEQYSTSKTIDYQLVKDVLSNWLDHEKGHLVTDQKISKEFASFWENDFFIDMDSLKIKRPDILTRVSEYVPEIIEFCNQIIKNGYAYEVNGSVYFDIAKFSADGHDYAKLAPWSAGNMKLVQEGEGDLTSETTQKKNDSDFALWKNSKAGEPFWDSPWGKGRPGWHIECSVMAGAIVGDGMDIHGGGIDLQFPHHDNELAQSEAHYKCHQWVNYFMHTGHLHVENMKMSKSLKNFLPIKEYLKTTSPSQMRLMFLLHQWDSVLDYSAGSVSEAKAVESTIQNFLSLVTALRNEKHESIGHNYSTPEKQLIIQLQKSQDLVHAALCDSFNTPQVMLEIRNLISSANIYYADKQKHKALPNTDVMFKIARYVTKMMRVFGVFEEQDPIGSFGQQNQSSTDLLPILNTMSEFRDTIRKLAQENKDKTVLEVCDKFRDIDMVDHGVVLVDREGTKALVKLVDKKVLAEQKLEMKLKNDQVQTLKNERKQKELEVQELRRKKAEILPGEMFKTEEFSEWDDEGVPVMMKDGEEVSKSRRKKLVKEYEAQVKLYKEFH